MGSSDYGILGRNDHIKFSTRFLTKWSPSGEAYLIKVPGTEKPNMCMKSLTKDGWFCAGGNGNWICNIFKQDPKKITYSIDGLANKNIGFSNSYPGNFIINGQKGYQPKEVPFPSNNFWVKKGKINSMNVKGDVAGAAATCSGEQHAILLLND